MMWILHIAAVIFFFPALIITIPAHCVIKAIEKNNKPAPVIEGGERKQVFYKEGRVSDRNKAIIGVVLFVLLALAFGALGR